MRQSGFCSCLKPPLAIDIRRGVAKMVTLTKKSTRHIIMIIMSATAEMIKMNREIVLCNDFDTSSSSFWKLDSIFALKRLGLVRLAADPSSQITGHGHAWSWLFLSSQPHKMVLFSLFSDEKIAVLGKVASSSKCLHIIISPNHHQHLYISKRSVPPAPLKNCIISRANKKFPVTRRSYTKLWQLYYTTTTTIILRNLQPTDVICEQSTNFFNLFPQNIFGPITLFFLKCAPFLFLLRNAPNNCWFNQACLGSLRNYY